ncbi:uncharacterized protein EDB91DRAFT_1241824 [Suillus paluster]|uniref:uncharacterized protein n=1 Tax=Suillus paluster TaxID=48578 RepID=UPI001B860129|nr:uncharacterized protein EDB91DRAFT_1241824 [Suillus paluster]KAG1756776.1 hypothetical protein EDB91DRAFT_1241824 [Suillus paluster]
MTDKQKVIVALTSASETCTAALSALASRNQRDEPEPQTSDLVVILKDLDSLLSLIYNSSTKLALALKPSSPTYSASLPVIVDLTKYTSSIAHCINLLNADLHGGTLIKEVQHNATVILEALRAVVQTFLNLAARGPSIRSGAAGEDYLVRTGALHDLITQARGTNGIPKDNISAICRKWKQDLGALDDGLREVSEMIEGVEGSESDNLEGDDDDDGWDELGLSDTGAKMNQDELARAKNVQPSSATFQSALFKHAICQVHSILRLTTLLHKRILLDLLSSAPIMQPPNVALDALLLQSHALLAASDELVASLYVPQNPATIRKDSLALLGVINALHLQLRIFFPDTSSLEQQLSGLSIEGESTPSKPKADKKWFDICFDQVTKTSTNLVSPYKPPPGVGQKPR